MSLNLEMDIGDLLNGLLGKKSGDDSQIKDSPSAKRNDNPFKKPILIAVSVVMLFGAFMAGVYSPYVSNTVTKKMELLEAQNKKTKIAEMDSQTKALKNDLAVTEDYYRNILGSFNDQEDLGPLYESVSNLATTNNLVVLYIKESGKKVTEQKKYGTSISESEVEMELQGKYGNYMNFKEALAKESTLMSINSETIVVTGDQENPGKISSKLKLLVYTVDKRPFEKLISSISDVKHKIMAENE